MCGEREDHSKTDIKRDTKKERKTGIRIVSLIFGDVKASVC